MSATDPNVVVRVFSDLKATLASIDTRDSTVIGMCLPAPLADPAKSPVNEPVKVSTDDVELVASLGAGLVEANLGTSRPIEYRDGDPSTSVDPGRAKPLGSRTDRSLASRPLASPLAVTPPGRTAPARRRDATAR